MKILTVAITTMLSLFLFKISFSQEQHVFKMKMCVHEVEFDRKSYCTEDTTVLWGVKVDTMCFSFMDKMRCYYTIQDSVWSRLSKDKQQRYRVTTQAMNNEKDLDYFILQDRYGELYSIMFAKNLKQGSFTIFITCIPYGIPSYALAYGPKVSCR